MSAEKYIDMLILLLRLPLECSNSVGLATTLCKAERLGRLKKEYEEEYSVNDDEDPCLRRQGSCSVPERASQIHNPIVVCSENSS
eukprot:349071-Amphidinium_carterae.1